MSFPQVGAIDCDIHPAVPAMEALIPYLDEHWREQVMVRGIGGLDSSSFPPSAPANCRPDWRADGMKPGSSLELLRDHALEPFGARAAICNCLYGAPGAFNADFAAASARAINDWLAAEWLDREPRLRGSIVIAVHDPELAAAEIERRAADRRFVQVLVPAAVEVPLGRRICWPIYAAAEKHGLPLCIHAGSTFRHATSSNGWPSYYLEDYVLMAHAFQAQLLSLIAEGVFSKFPELTVVLAESGFTWLPQFMWRQVKTWRAMRMEIPWVDRSPAEIIRQNVRITLQPTDAPPEPGQLAQVVDMIGTDRLLLFSTDYPHWQFEADAALPAGLDASLLQRMLVDNPLETYPRLKDSRQ